MTVKQQAMVIGITNTDNTKTYEMISTDEFNKKPYSVYRVKSFSEPTDLNPEFGSIVEKQHDVLYWLERFSYNSHNFEYATIYGITCDRMQVYGSKIGLRTIEKYNTKNNSIDRPIFEFHRGDKLLLEVNKTIRIIHNIDQAKLIFEMDKLGPNIR